MRSGDARKNFPKISINNVITLATRVRITLLKVFKLFLIWLILLILLILLQFIFSLLFSETVTNWIFCLGHGRRIFETPPTWICHRYAVPKSPGDFGPRREESQAHNYELRRGHLFTCDATSNRRINPVLIKFLFVISILIFSPLHCISFFLFEYPCFQACLQSLLLLQQLSRKNAVNFLYLIGRQHWVYPKVRPRKPSPAQRRHHRRWDGDLRQRANREGFSFTQSLKSAQA